MARFGIVAKLNLGISVSDLRGYARALGKNQRLAEELWVLEYRELRVLATLIGEPDKITRRTMDRWVRDLDSWDICDACCYNLFDRSPHAEQKAHEWSTRLREFEKRAAFATVAGMANHLKAASDEMFSEFLVLIERESSDDRNFVRKAVNWALRQIGKRNFELHQAAIEAARRIREQGTRPARWIAADALRELQSSAVQARLKAKMASRSSLLK